MNFVKILNNIIILIIIKRNETDGEEETNAISYKVSDSRTLNKTHLMDETICRCCMQHGSLLDPYYTYTMNDGLDGGQTMGRHADNSFFRSASQPSIHPSLRKWSDAILNCRLYKLALPTKTTTTTSILQVVNVSYRFVFCLFLESTSKHYATTVYRIFGMYMF